MFVSVVLLLYRNREFWCFDWTKTNRRPTETVWQFDREHILVFFHIILCCFGLFRVVSVCLGLFRFVSVCFETVCFGYFEFYTKTASFDVWIELKQTEDQPKQFNRERVLVFFRKFRVVLVCFGLIRNSSVCLSCFDIGSKHRNKPKQTET